MTDLMTGQREAIADFHRRLAENADPDCPRCAGWGRVEFSGPTPGKHGTAPCSRCFGFGDVDPMRPIWPGAEDRA